MDHHGTTEGVQEMEIYTQEIRHRNCTHSLQKNVSGKCRSVQAKWYQRLRLSEQIHLHKNSMTFPIITTPAYTVMYIHVHQMCTHARTHSHPPSTEVGARGTLNHQPTGPSSWGLRVRRFASITPSKRVRQVRLIPFIILLYIFTCSLYTSDSFLCECIYLTLICKVASRLLQLFSALLLHFLGPTPIFSLSHPSPSLPSVFTFLSLFCYTYGLAGLFCELHGNAQVQKWRVC